MAAASPTLSPGTEAPRPPEAAREGTPQGSRAALLMAAGTGLALVVILRCAYPQIYWNVFRDVRLDVWWPVAALVGALAFPATAWLRHRRDGLARFYPVSGFIVAAMLFASPPFLAWSWGADRSAVWCLSALLLGTISAIAVAATFICYSELWRASTGWIVTRVRAAIADGEFDQYLNGASRPVWGSEHCLEIVYGDYRARKQALLEALAGSATRSTVAACVAGGDRLSAYLALRWPGGEPGSGWGLRRAHVAREMAVLRLWAADVSARSAIPAEAIARDIAVVIAGFEAFPELTAFLSAVLLLAVTARQQGVDRAASVREIIRLYRAIPSRCYIIDGEKYEAQRIARDTWVAVGPTAVPGQVALDVWRRMSGPDFEPPGTPPSSTDPDPASMWAAARLAALYREWGHCIHDVDPAWAFEIIDREGQAAQAVRGWSERARDIWPEAVDAAAGSSSWVYRYVWKAPAVWISMCLLIGAAAGGYVYTLKETVPAMPGNTGGNVVDHVEDRRFGHDYAAGEMRAMASTDKALLLAGGQGLLHFDRASRIVTPIASGSFLDVAANRAGDRIFGVATDQSVHFWRGSRLVPGTLLTRPAHPYWPGGETANETSISANWLDARGWTVAVKDKGLARYLCDVGADGLCRGRRDWMLPNPLANVPLQSAVISPSGVWVRTATTVEFAGMKDLDPQPARHLGESLVSLDAGPRGDWAWGRSAAGSAWIYHPSHAWQGPYFCSSDTGVRSEAEISVVARTGAVAWFATAGNLLSYHSGRRCLAVALPGVAVRQIEPAGASAIAAARGGVYELQPSGAVNTIDKIEDGKGEIDAMSVTPNGGLLLYRKVQENGTEILGRTPKNASVHTVFPSKGWSGPEGRTPGVILALRTAGERFLFVSRGGAFFYDPLRHMYDDASKAHFPIVDQNGGTADSQQMLGEFSFVLREPSSTHRLLAIAGGNAVRMLDNETEWTSLDPRRLTVARALAATGDRVIGLGFGGQIHYYAPQRADFLVGESQALAKTPPAINRFLGDFLPGKQGPRIAILHAGVTVLYDPSSSALSDTPLPKSLGNAAEVRFTSAGGLLYRTSAGTIANPTGDVLFGSGSLPFEPSRVTALAGGTGDVLVGGPDGTVSAYNWSTGSFVRVSSRPAAPVAVTRIQRIDAGNLVTYADGAVDYVSGGKTCRVDARHVVGRGKFVYAAGHIGVRRLTDSHVCDAAVLEPSAGMHDFVGSAVFAWSNRPTSIMFFTADGRLGAFDSNSGVWSNRWFSTQPRAFTATSNEAYILARNELVRVDAKAVSGILANLPENASMRAFGGGVRVAYTAGDGIRVRQWTGNTEGVSAMRGGRQPATFEPGKTRCAVAERTGRIRLVDARGAMADYLLDSAQWDEIFPSEGGAEFVGCSLDAREGFGERVRRVFSGASLRVFFRGKDGALLERDAETGALVPVMAPGHWIQDQPLSTSRFRFVPGTPPSFRRNTGQGWQELHAVGNGFAEDRYESAVVADDAAIWARQGARLIEFRAEGDRLVETGRVRPFGDEARIGAPPPAPSVTLAVAGSHLRWSRAGASYVAEWEEPVMRGLPVFGSCGSLASECLLDLGIGPSNELIVVTEAGTVVRDPETLAPLAWHRDRSGFRFLRSPVEYVVETGPWTWALGDGSLRIVHRRTNAERSVERDEDGWHFRDDRATFIRRDGAALFAETRNGVWQIDDRGIRRGDGDFNSGPSSPAYEVFSDGPYADPGGLGKVISIVRQREWLTLSPRDSGSRPAFQDGRFFFDTAQSIAAAPDALYTLVPQRGVVRRNLERPNEIADFWQLPTTTEPLSGIEATRGTIRLLSTRDTGSSGIGFTRTPGDSVWHAWHSSPETDQITVGHVTWRASVQSTPIYEPQMRTGEKVLLPHWWSSGRFAWDDVRAFGCLADDVAVFSTAAGLIALPLDGGPEVVMWTITDTLLDHMATARRNGQTDGLVAWGQLGGMRVTRSGNRVQATYVKRPSDSLEGFGLVLTRGNSPEGGEILLRERWGRPGEWHPLTSELKVPVFAAGQISIDGATAAVPLQVSGRTEWWTAASCYAGQCALVRNEIAGGRLVARDIAPAPCRFDYLREVGGAILGACLRDGVWAVFRLESRGSWIPTELMLSADAFRLGGNVTFDVTTLTWRTSGHQLPWSSAALSITPNGFPMFASDGQQGDALSFDIVKAVSYDDASSTLDIGTEGGLFRWRVSDSAPLYLRPQTGTLEFVFDPSVNPAQWVTGINRLRRDTEGRLWAWTSGRQALARFAPPGNWEFQAGVGSTGEFSRNGWTVTFGGDGISNSQARWLQSTDAFGVGVAPIENVIDFDVEPGAVWVATTNRGLFKIFTAIP